MFRFGAGRRSPAAQRDPNVAAGAGDALDVALMTRVVARDLTAFETLYRIYDARLGRFLGLMIARGTIVEEVLNDTMLVVWNRAATYNHQSKVSTWIFAIAYRTALKALHRHDEPLADPTDEPAAEQPGPERRRSDGESRAALLHALDMLSREQRSVLVLTYFHELPYAEIAQIMSCPVDTVKTRVFHGRRRLRAMLHETLGDAT